jgi:hypothetical protein
MLVRPSHRHLGALVALALLAALPGVASASHSWGNYHWARTVAEFTLKVGDNVSTTWDSYLDTTISDWSQSTVLDLTKVTGAASGRQCRPSIAGRVEVCNGRYGNNGWLGIAQIWVSGSHITKGSVRNNDTYFDTSTYNTPAWRNLVMCQEVGHTFGLNHQDENFNNANLGTCMDYTNDPDGGAGGASSSDPANTAPNAHDYDQLVSIYAHLDSTTTVGAAAPTGAGAGAWHSEFGLRVASSASGRTSTFVRDLGNGLRLITHVIWA